METCLSLAYKEVQDTEACSSYVKGQIRVTGKFSMRVQAGAVGKYIETDASCSADLSHWLAKLPQLGKSFAESGTPYALCQVRATGEHFHVRIQVPGPAFNRDYGAAFTIKSGKLAMWLTLHAPTTTPATPVEPASTDPAPEAEPHADPVSTPTAKYDLPTNEAFKAWSDAPFESEEETAANLTCHTCGKKVSDHFGGGSVCPCATCGHSLKFCKCPPKPTNPASGLQPGDKVKYVNNNGKASKSFLDEHENQLGTVVTVAHDSVKVKWACGNTSGTGYLENLVKVED